MRTSQVVASFTSTGTLLTITTPPNSTIAPPGNYLVFAVSAKGRPSQGVYVGLGGAVPAAKVYVPIPTPVLADGVYTIQSTAATLTGCKNLYVPTCGDNGASTTATTGKLLTRAQPGVAFCVFH